MAQMQKDHYDNDKHDEYYLQSTDTHDVYSADRVPFMYTC